MSKEISEFNSKEADTDHYSVDHISLFSNQTGVDQNQIPFKEKLKLFWTFKNPRSTSVKKKFFLWSPPGQSKYETKLVFKLDCIILTYVCLSFFIRYLDASNISNAYVSGMKEDLNMHGTMYNWLTRSFYIAYAIFGLPLTLLITRVKPHILLPALEVIWGVLCLLVITCKNYKTLMVVRTLQGAAEGSCFPLLHALLGSWYNKNELSKRTGLFIASGALGTMFGGYIQSGVYRTLNNKAGLPGWRWIFVIDFIITIPVAILGYFMIPDSPDTAKPSKFLSQEDLDYCKERVRVVKDVDATTGFNFKVFKKLLTSWQFYAFTFYYAVGHLPGEAGSYWAIVLKAEGYNVYQRNNIPTIQSAVDVIGCILAGFYVDGRGKFWEGAAIVHVIWIIGVALLVKWDIPRVAQFIAYSFCGMSGAASTLCCSWANEMTKEDLQLRAGVLGSLNLILTGASTAFSIVAYNTDYAPKFEKGNRISLAILIVSFLTGIILIGFDRYQNRKRDYIEDILSRGKVSESIEEGDMNRID